MTNFKTAQQLRDEMENHRLNQWNSYLELLALQLTYAARDGATSAERAFLYPLPEDSWVLTLKTQLEAMGHVVTLVPGTGQTTSMTVSWA